MHCRFSSHSAMKIPSAPYRAAAEWPRCGPQNAVSGNCIASAKNTSKTTISDDVERLLGPGTDRPSRRHEQTPMRTEGTADRLRLHPAGKAEVDEGCRGLVKKFPDQVNAPPRNRGTALRPARSTPRERRGGASPCAVSGPASLHHRDPAVRCPSCLWSSCAIHRTASVCSAQRLLSATFSWQGNGGSTASWSQGVVSFPGRSTKGRRASGTGPRVPPRHPRPAPRTRRQTEAVEAIEAVVVAPTPCAGPWPCGPWPPNPPGAARPAGR